MSEQEGSSKLIVGAYLVLGAAVAGFAFVLVLDRFFSGATVSGPNDTLIVVSGVPGLLINSAFLLLVAWFFSFIAYLANRNSHLAILSGAIPIAALLLLAVGYLGRYLGWGT